jgi:hypothetical protein
MRARIRTGALAVVGFVALEAQPAWAAFHLMQIEQVIGGVNGDITAQAVQLRMRLAGQNVLASTRIRVFDASGMNPIVFVDFNGNVPNAGNGARILVVTPNFPLHTVPAAVDDVAVAVTAIPESYLCAGSMTFESDTGAIIYWRVSWGGAGYTGPTTGDITNDSDGQFGPPFPGPLPSTSSRALRFQGAASAMSTNNAADYALTSLASVFTSNVPASYTVQNCTVNGDCNDGVTCTVDTCSGGDCVFTANHSLCSDGVFCNGAEMCVVSPGECEPDCVAASEGPCSVPANCSETQGVCIPAMSTYGLVALAILTLIAATIVLQRRREGMHNL